MAKVCHVCSAHPADDPRVFARSCVALAEAGYEVHLVARSDRKSSYRDHDVTVHPVPAWRSRRERMARRNEAAALAKSVAPDLYHVHEPELLGPVLARAGGKPVIWDAHESYLDVVQEREWIPRPLRPAVRLAWDLQERSYLRGCAAVITVTEPIAVRYRKLHRTVLVLANYPELSRIPPVPTSERDRTACVFAGGIMQNRGIGQVIAALGILQGRGIPVSFDLAGSIDEPIYFEQLMAEAVRLGVRDRIRYHGVLSKKDALELQRRCGIGLVPNLRTFGNNRLGLPGKLLEFMASGLPVVYSDLPSYRQVADSAGAGFAVDPARPEEIADAIQKLVEDPGTYDRMAAAARHAIERRFNWGQEKIKLLDLYRKLMPCLAPPNA